MTKFHAQSGHTCFAHPKHTCFWQNNIDKQNVDFILNLGEQETHAFLDLGASASGSGGFGMSEPRFSSGSFLAHVAIVCFALFSSCVLIPNIEPKFSKRLHGPSLRLDEPDVPHKHWPC